MIEGDFNMEEKLLEIDEQLQREGGFNFLDLNRLNKQSNSKFTPSKIPSS